MTLILIAILIVALLFIGFLVHQTLGNNRAGTSAHTQANLGTSADTSLQLTSTVDYNHNGVDDYTDMVASARKDAQDAPQYDTGYYQGGYPPDDRGACTDLVWRAFRNAGYDLKSMVDADIAAHSAAYASVISKPDPNIDFRRSSVLGVFFSRYGQTLTTDTADSDQWKQADLVIFDKGTHIGMVSDRRGQSGLPLLLHNMGQDDRENDYLNDPGRMAITAHYRFDASQVPADVLKEWKD